MHRSAVAGGVPLPYFGTFAETNVRLYSVDAAGRHGVLFRSLETTRLAVGGGDAARHGCALHLGQTARHPHR